MNKKIYYNNRYIEFTGDAIQPTQHQSLKIISAADNKNKIIKHVLDDLLSESSTQNYLVTSIDSDDVLALIRPHFHYLQAAGGFIEKKDRFLFIYRLGRWDLPKGKLEKNESVEHCAVRECEEECGIRELVIKRPLSSTWHIYPHKGRFVLKQTWWFHMQTSFEGELQPQLEEDIHEVKWFNREEINAIALKNTYHTISDVVKEGLSS